MRFENFHHIIRAAAAITNETVFVVVGSQAILAQYPNAPAALLASQELDIYPKFRPELAELIEGAIGYHSSFHGTFGYHADGVGPETAKLPRDWETRALRVQAPTTGMATAVCPEASDLVASKLVAGREKDIEWARAAIGAKLVDAAIVAERLDKVDIDPEIPSRAKNAIAIDRDRKAEAPMDKSRHASERREYLELIFGRLENGDEAIRERARKLISLWRSNGVDPLICDRWTHLLDGSAAIMRATALAPTEEGEHLRHSIPFAGILSNKERMDLHVRHGGVTHP